jgi:hypothetical protein
LLCRWPRAPSPGPPPPSCAALLFLLVGIPVRRDHAAHAPAPIRQGQGQRRPIRPHASWTPRQRGPPLAVAHNAGTTS